MLVKTAHKHFFYVAICQGKVLPKCSSKLHIRTCLCGNLSRKSSTKNPKLTQPNQPTQHNPAIKIWLNNGL